MRSICATIKCLSLTAIFGLVVNSVAGDKFCLFGEQKYKKSNSLDDVMKLNTTRVLFSQIIGPSILQMPNVTKRTNVRSHAVILEIDNGFIYGDTIVSTYLDHASGTAMVFNCWENSLIHTKQICTNRTVVQGTVISFMIPWGAVFSHNAATMLPKLNFTCNLLTHEITILLPSDLSKTMLLWVCPSAEQSKFIIASKLRDTHGQFVLQADSLLWPFHFTAIPSGIIGKSDVADLSFGTLKPLNNATFSPNSTRTILFFPRRRFHSRYMEDEFEIVSQMCHMVSYDSHLKVHVFIPTDDPVLDRENLLLKNARAIVSPHSGAMANMLFVPQDTAIIEINDLEVGNWFYVSFASVLGLDYYYAKADSYSHDNQSIPLIVRVPAIKEALLTAVPELRAGMQFTKQDKAHVKECFRNNLDVLVDYRRRMLLLH